MITPQYLNKFKVEDETLRVMYFALIWSSFLSFHQQLNHFISHHAGEVLPTSKIQSTQEFYLVSPIVRRKTQGSLVNQSPCGGIQKGHTHYLTKPGGRLLVQWNVIQPSANGNCTIKIGPGKNLGSLGVNPEKDVALAPLDGTGDSENGSFSCGRVMTKFEAKEVRLPTNLSCDSCVLQIVWNTENGDIYQCADIMIDNDEGNLGLPNSDEMFRPV